MSVITYNNFSEDFQSLLPIYFFTACSHHLQENINRPNGASLFHQVMFVVDGTGILKCDSHSFELKKGCAFFTAADMPVEYINTEGLITAFLTARGSAVNDIMKYFSCNGFLFYESINYEKYLSEINNIIQKYHEHKREGLLSAMVYSFYTDFFEHQNNQLTKLDEVTLYIEKNFMKKLTLAQLADIGCMSVSKLCHEFKKKYNLSVFQYILNLRLTYAHTLLLTSPKTTTKEAAVSSGFDDISYFCRAYKNKFGINASEEQKRFFSTSTSSHPIPDSYNN